MRWGMKPCKRHQMQRSWGLSCLINIRGPMRMELRGKESRSWSLGDLGRLRPCWDLWRTVKVLALTEWDEELLEDYNRGLQCSQDDSGCCIKKGRVGKNANLDCVVTIQVKMVQTSMDRKRNMVWTYFDGKVREIWWKFGYGAWIKEKSPKWPSDLGLSNWKHRGTILWDEDCNRRRMGGKLRHLVLDIKFGMPKRIQVDESNRWINESGVQGRESRLKISIWELSVIQFSLSVMSNSLWPHGLQHTRPPCPSPTPGVYSNSCSSSRWCHPTISSSVVPFYSHFLSFPASGSFQMSQFFASGGQIIGVSASASVFPMNIQDWFPLEWTSWISLQSKGLSRVFSNITV